MGLRTGDRRRAVGLRREELAGLAAISVDYLTRLEQGRATSPSAPVVEALARSLQLSGSECDLLYGLAGLAAPGPGVVPTRITPGVQRLLDRRSGVPLVVHDAAWNLVVANAPYDALMGETSAQSGNDRNGVWRQIVGQGSRALQTAEEHDERVSRLVADLRLTACATRATPDFGGSSPSCAPRAHASSNSGRPPPTRLPPAHPVIKSSTTQPSARSPSRATPSSSPATTPASWAYTAEPHTEDADRRELTIVHGTQSLIE